MIHVKGEVTKIVFPNAVHWKSAKHKFIAGSVFPGSTLPPTLTFCIFISFVSKCIPRNQLNQAETQNSNERQIAVGASKPNLVDILVLKKSQTLWGCIRSSNDKSSEILYWIKRSANDSNSPVWDWRKGRTRQQQKQRLHARSSWGTTRRPNPH